MVTMEKNGISAVKEAVPAEMTQSECVYHRRLFQQMQLAQASWQMWCAHLNDFYHLTPHDAINEDGFVRGAPPTAPSEE